MIFVARARGRVAGYGGGDGSVKRGCESNSSAMKKDYFE